MSEKQAGSLYLMDGLSEEQRKDFLDHNYVEDLSDWTLLYDSIGFTAGAGLPILVEVEEDEENETTKFKVKIGSDDLAVESVVSLTNAIILGFFDHMMMHGFIMPPFRNKPFFDFGEANISFVNSDYQMVGVSEGELADVLKADFRDEGNNPE